MSLILPLSIKVNEDVSWKGVKLIQRLYLSSSRGFRVQKKSQSNSEMLICFGAWGWSWQITVVAIFYHSCSEVECCLLQLWSLVLSCHRYLWLYWCTVVYVSLVYFLHWSVLNSDHSLILLLLEVKTSFMSALLCSSFLPATASSSPPLTSRTIPNISHIKVTRLKNPVIRLSDQIISFSQMLFSSQNWTNSVLTSLQ